MTAITFSVTEAELLAVWRQHRRRVWSNPTGDQVARTFRRVLGGLLVLIGGGTYLFVFFSMSCLLVPAFTFSLFLLILWKTRGAAYTAAIRTNKPLLYETTLHLAARELHLECRGTQSRIARPAITRWEETPTLFILTDSTGASRPIPKRAFTDPQADELRAWLQLDPFDHSAPGPT